ncbi:TIGR03943 family putative permease subunit [Domibacillus indicus]|uniref:TIGR03943 family putative permease subunit n=1 Tax=Domibacillus indicus TaxID=1437523 RepID=UPI0006180DF7|nr:TIGR03943 family protein [Domibacillus indicus]
MVIHVQQAFRAVILAAFALFLLRLHGNGEITKYINPEYILLSKTAAYLFLFLLLVQLFRIAGKKPKSAHTCSHTCGCDHDHAGQPGKKVLSYSILVFPLLTGFFLPPQTLGASMAAKKGMVFTAQTADSSTQETDSALYDHAGIAASRKEMKQSEFERHMSRLEQDSLIHMENEVFEPYYREISTEPQNYAGRTVRMSGFVYKEDGFRPDQLALTRFLITHCVADAGSIGFLTEFDEAALVEQDMWLEIEGTIELTQYDGTEMPLLKVTSWEVIEEPDDPYVYPVYVKLL